MNGLPRPRCERAVQRCQSPSIVRGSPSCPVARRLWRSIVMGVLQRHKSTPRREFELRAELEAAPYTAASRHSNGRDGSGVPPRRVLANLRSEVNDAKPPPEHRQPIAMPPSSPPERARFYLPTALPWSGRRCSKPSCAADFSAASSSAVSAPSPARVAGHSPSVLGSLPADAFRARAGTAVTLAVECSPRRAFQVALRRGVMSSASQVMNRRTRFGTVRP
jgi:hypothetical protein